VVNRILGSLAPLFFAGFFGCYAGAGDREEVRAVSSKTIEEVLATHTDSLMALPGVVGTAIGLCDDRQCIRVFLADSSAEARREVPEEIEGYPVKVDVTGPIRPRRPRKG
jgi:hypothetical protein